LGFVGGLLGTAGGAFGTGANVTNPQAQIQPTTAAQANTAYTGTQDALTQQQNLLNAIQAQNGLQNQSQIYGQLQNIASGQGPNPAQSMLNQATGQNVANQAALMAGQRGSGANAGLMARQAAQQGAATQQQAVGQGATMQAQQALGAIGQAGQLANQQAANQIGATSAVTGAQMGEQNQLLNAIQGQNSTNAQLSGAQAGLANTQMQGQQNLLGNITGGIGSALGLAEGGRVMAANGLYADTSTDNFDTATQPTAQAAPIAAPAAPSAPTISSAATPASTVGKHFFSQNQSAKTPLTGMSLAGNAIGQGIGKGLKSLFGNSNTPGADAAFKAFDNDNSVHSQDLVTPGTTSTPATYTNAPGGGALDVTDQTKMAHGGKVKALVSPGEIRIHAKDVKKVAEGKKSPLKGEKIPGKPKVGGAKNSYANDTVPKTLNEGDIILPRSVTQAKHPHWAAHKFVQDIMMQKHRKK